MNPRSIAWAIAALILFSAADVISDPILKPRKYYGPIPQSSFTLRVGFLAGPDNNEMFDVLDRQVELDCQPCETFSEEVGNSIVVDGTYVFKVHPQFAVRASISAAFLRQSGTGNRVPRVEVPDTILTPELDYTREFEVDLFTFEASALYFFTDAGVKDFQPYAGGGFSVGLPHARFKEVRVDKEKEFQDFSNTVEDEKWSTEAGVHAILGALYYVTNKLAFSLEGRVQMLHSKFPIDVIDPGSGEPLKFKAKVDYTGFILSFGVTRAF